MTLDDHHPPEPGRYYLGYLAQPWTCESYDPESGIAMMRGGQPGYGVGEPIAWTRRQWRGLVEGGSQP